jgi:hypothetical protein
MQQRQLGGLDRNDRCACSAVALINCAAAACWGFIVCLSEISSAKGAES